jgi:hypothetical protein
LRRSRTTPGVAVWTAAFPAWSREKAGAAAVALFFSFTHTIGSVYQW